MLRFILFIILLLSIRYSAQELEEYSYFATKYNTENILEDELHQLISKSIHSAKENSNYAHLSLVYEDAVYYSRDNSSKLKFADSALQAAKKSGVSQLVAQAHLGKGIVYYHHFSEYQKALYQFLAASKIVEKSGDSYLRGKVNYNLGLIYAHLGYNNEAILVFSEALSSFSVPKNREQSSVVTANMNKGYFNSLYQLASTYERKGEINSAGRLVNAGIKSLARNQALATEYNRMLFLSGLIYFRKGNFEKSVPLLRKVLGNNRLGNDKAMVIKLHYYLAKSLDNLGEPKGSINNLIKIDSIFRATQISVPEVSDTYRDLIRHTKNNRESYLRSLVISDSILKADNNTIARELHNLDNARKDNDLKKDKQRFKYLSYWTVFGGSAMLFIGFGYIQKKKRHNKKQLSATKYLESSKNEPVPISDTIRMDLLDKLRIFEIDKQFLKKDISLSFLAKEFKTNSSHLSHVINKEKELSFTNYINKLRIEYIKTLMLSDRKYMNYTVDALAEEAGMASRQNFSKYFVKYSGYSVKDFISKYDSQNSSSE